MSEHGKHGPLEPGIDLVDAAWKVYLEATGDRAGVNAFHAAAHAVSDHLGGLAPSDVAREAARICRECEEYERALRDDVPRDIRSKN